MASCGIPKQYATKIQSILHREIGGRNKQTNIQTLEKSRDKTFAYAVSLSRKLKSPCYFGDMVHRETGGTAIGYIHTYVINQAKSLLMNGHNISETSRLLGFDFPHHFTRLFKRITGITPSEFLGK